MGWGRGEGRETGGLGEESRGGEGGSRGEGKG